MSAGKRPGRNCGSAGAEASRQPMRAARSPAVRRAVSATLAVALGLELGWLRWQARAGRRAEPVARSGSVDASAVLPPPLLADPKALAGLNEAGTDPRADVRIVGAVLRNYLQTVTGAGAPPLGFNEEVVRALGGANPFGVVFLPQRHPAIDARGRLCDRWGTPYLFHPLAAEDYEIRSAGPDRRLFTADDLIGRSAGE